MYDEEVEKTVLYYLIFEQEEEVLSQEDFFITKNRQIYEAIENLKRKKEEINILSIKDSIKGKDVDILLYISEIAESRYGSSFEYAYTKLKELSKKRKLLKFNKDLELDLKEGIEDVDIYIEKQIKKLKEIDEEGEKEESFKDTVIETSDIITKKYIQKENYENKYTTGIFDLDEVTNRFTPRRINNNRC